uniref:Uncharacterized protein n=1 Tax=Physcomitrium patens TaxID=3218 RepID=A0A2K1IV85_PHYPA|nr:hypothetical protein PHYPA_025121 [Physcomitrium patens]
MASKARNLAAISASIGSTNKNSSPLTMGHNFSALKTNVSLSIILVIGSTKTSVRISPILNYKGIIDFDPVGLGLYLPRFHLPQGLDKATHKYKIYRNEYKGVFMTTGSYSRKKGMKAIRIGYIDLDLLKQFYFNLSVNDYDQSTFYTHDPCVSYTNYPSITATLDNIDIYTIVASPTLHDSTQALYDACY